ncbi:TPA: hypothetical protein ACJXM0_003193, partial [Salmonella enterica subsp. enterica serovar Agona]
MMPAKMIPAQNDSLFSLFSELHALTASMIIKIAIRATTKRQGIIIIPMISPPLGLCASIMP